MSAKAERWGMNEWSINSTANINRFDAMLRFEFNIRLSVLDVFKSLTQAKSKSSSRKVKY